MRKNLNTTVIRSAGHPHMRFAQWPQKAIEHAE